MSGSDEAIGEEDGELVLRALLRIRAVDDVLTHQEGEVAADGAGSGVHRVRGAHHGADGLAVVGVFGDHFGDDMAGTFEGFGGIAEGGGEVGEGLAVGDLFQHIDGEGFEAFLAGNAGFGFALGLIGKVEIFEFGLVEGLLDFGLKFGGELALFLDGAEDGGSAVFEFAEVLELLLDGEDLDLVEVAGGFLAVAGDEGDGAAFVEEGDGGDQALERDCEEFRDV